MRAKSSGSVAYMHNEMEKVFDGRRVDIVNMR